MIADVRDHDTVEQWRYRIFDMTMELSFLSLLHDVHTALSLHTEQDKLNGLSPEPWISDGLQYYLDDPCIQPRNT